MIEGIVKSAFEALLTQGSGWIVAVLLVIGGIFVTRRHDVVIKRYEDQRNIAQGLLNEQYEKRIATFKEVVSVVEQSTSILSILQTNADGHKDAINKLVSGFSQLVRDVENQDDFHKDRHAAIVSTLTDLRARVETLQRRV